MARPKNRRRSPFPVEAQPARAQTTRNPVEQIYADEQSPGIFGFMREIGVRETVESIIIAVILALMFRTYEAEAFVIPTGSMAPSLQGQHMDLECANCGLNYRSGATANAGRDQTIDSTYCPICQFRTKIRISEPTHKSFKGDRILVNKFIYDFSQPNRYDVIVFKNPNNGKQNYIKRLIGLPGENILIENGDIYVMPPQAGGGFEKRITRKPPHKLNQILQTVDDTHYIGEKLKSVGWPSRWSDAKSAWQQLEAGGNPVFKSDSSDQPNWLRYRHYQPRKEEWPTIEVGSLPSRFSDGARPPGSLIGDQYAYNDGLQNGNVDSLGRPKTGGENLGLHWVGDIGIECWVDVTQATGKLLLDVVEGGAHFICQIDVASGQAELRCDDSLVDTKVTFRDASGNAIAAPTGKTGLKGKGSYQIKFVNADDRLLLWVDDQLVEFDAAEFTRTGIPIPTYSQADAGDAEPAGVAAVGMPLTVNRLKIVRDIYYTSVRSFRGQLANRDLDNETGTDFSTVVSFHRNPENWSTPAAKRFFRMKKGQTEPMFQLEEGIDSAQDQFLPMGDNSPMSLDGRVWDGPKYVERDMLIGRAMLIYWPHAKTEPLPFWPNFERMGFIR